MNGSGGERKPDCARLRSEIRAMQKASGELDGLSVGAQNRSTVRAAINMPVKRHSRRSAHARQ